MRKAEQASHNTYSADASITVIFMIATAEEIRPTRNQKQLSDRIDYQTQVIDLCNDLLCYLELASEEHCIDNTSFEHWARMVVDVKLLTISWRNSDLKRNNN